jgi:hypothetical protein
VAEVAEVVVVVDVGNGNVAGSLTTLDDDRDRVGMAVDDVVVLVVDEDVDDGAEVSFLARFIEYGTTACGGGSSF